jgi:GTP-binding protein
MDLYKARFLGSFTKTAECPKDRLLEFAFIGRSNVGKSSLINLITNQNRLAKTSSAPGKTRLLNYFLVPDKLYLVDLPGYGYAKVSKKEKEILEGRISDYILDRKNLVCLFLLIDSRHDLQPIDTEFLIWLGENQIPFCIVFTKCDKLKPAELPKRLKYFEGEILKYWEELPYYFITSALKKTGGQELGKYILGLTKK